MPMFIRKYQSRDLDQILLLFKETVHAINQHDYNPSQLRAWAPKELDVNAWAKSLGEHITYVAILDKKIVGFADMSKNGYLDRFFVHKNYQGRLISKRLGHVLYQEAQRLNLKEVTANVSLTAMPLAKRLGFELVKEQEIECRGEQFINYQMKMKIVLQK